MTQGRSKTDLRRGTVQPARPDATTDAEQDFLFGAAEPAPKARPPAKPEPGATRDEARARRDDSRP